MSALRLLSIAAVIGCGNFVLAQQTEFDKLPAGKFTGTVQGVRRIANGIQIVGVEPFAQPPKPIYIMVAPQFLTSPPKVTGTAELDAVKTGMFCKFSANLKEDGTVEGPITEMYIYTPYGELPKVEPGEATEISGKIVSNNRKGTLMLSTEGTIRRIKIEVTPETKIFIDVTDLSLVRPGDKVDMAGKKNKVNGATKDDQLIAQTIVVEMAQPLTTKKPTRRKGGDQPKKPADPFGEGAKEAKKDATKEAKK